MSDLRDFLENIRKYSPKIGEVAMRHVSIFKLLIEKTISSFFNLFILI